MSVQGASGSALEHEPGPSQDAARKARPWIEPLARFGYATKGLVYTLIGVLAVQAAIGPGGKTTDTEGALRVILQQPFGWLLLCVVTAGLTGYAFWRLVQALWDADGKGTGLKGIVKRFGYGLSGLIYGGLAFTALQMLISAKGGYDQSAQRWVARLLTFPYGQWLIGAISVILIGMGLNALYVAYLGTFCEKLKLFQMSGAGEICATGVGKVGIAARGIVFGLIGGFMLQAALQADPNKARGLAGALKVLAQQSYGLWLLGIVALGFIAYGFYQFTQAGYRRILQG